MRFLRLAVLPLLVLLGVTGCGGGKGISDSVAPPPPQDTTRPPVVQRATITVQISIDPQDTATARMAGVGRGGVVVRLQRLGSGEPAVEAATGNDGTVPFPNLLEGAYTLTASRELTAAERQRLGAGDRDIGILAGGASVTLTPPTAKGAQIELVASRRGTLVLSEFYAWVPVVGTTPYNYTHYTEVTNTADTTVHLDGVLVVRSYPQQHAGTPESGYCPTLAPLRLDSAALWVNQIYRFPGEGRDFPLRPGASTVWAMDAINHAALFPGAPDLSRAQFEEIGGPGDVDNPSAAKMIRLTKGSDVVPRGYPMLSGLVTALVRPIARDTLGLQRQLLFPPVNVPVWRIPREAILDQASLFGTPERYTGTAIYQSGYRYCDPYLTPAHDRAMAQLVDSRVNVAIRRRSLGTTATGIPLLQRTRTSARDFETAEPLRRSLNR